MEVGAIVLAAGKGSRMRELAKNCPKAILPIGNYPMIWYPLRLLEEAGLEEVHVVVHDTAKSKIEDCLTAKCDLKIRIKFVVIPYNDDLGTAESLRIVYNSKGFFPKRDIVVVSCDLVTDFTLHRLLDVHRTHNSSLTALFAPLPPELVGLPIPGQKAKAKIERDLVGIEPKTSRLLFMNSEADFDDNVPLRASLFKKHARMTMRSNLLDGHFYVFKKWIMDYIIHEPTISAIKGELMPLIVAKQFSHQSTRVPPPSDASVIGMPQKKDIFQFAKLDPLLDLVNRLSSSMDTNEYYQLRNIKPAPISCYAYIADGALCMRANNVADYCELNRQVIKRSCISTGVERPLIVRQASTAQTRSQIGVDSLVGEGTLIGDKTSIKRSVIGHNCKIGEKVKITNCILLDNVKVGNGCSLQGSLICNNATLGELCELKDCFVAASQEVHSAAKLTNEHVSNVGDLMEVHM